MTAEKKRVQSSEQRRVDRYHVRSGKGIDVLQLSLFPQVIPFKLRPLQVIPLALADSACSPTSATKRKRATLHNETEGDGLKQQSQRLTETRL